MPRLISFSALIILAGLVSVAQADGPTSELRLLPGIEESNPVPRVPKKLSADIGNALRVLPGADHRQPRRDESADHEVRLTEVRLTEVRVTDVPRDRPISRVANYLEHSYHQGDPGLSEPVPPGDVIAPERYVAPSVSHHHPAASNCRYRAAIDTGCSCDQCRTVLPTKSCLTYRKNRPFGSVMVDMLSAQKCSGAAARMVLYDYDFLPDARNDILSLRGQQQLAKYARMAVACGHPIIIAATPGMPQLNEARRLYVTDLLQRIEPSASPDWVIVGRPKAVGLRGEEAIEIDINNIGATQQRGAIEAPATTGSSFSVVPGFGD